MQQNYTNNRKFTLCQPIKGKGCCVCCGLFNLNDISLPSLTRWLTQNSTLFYASNKQDQEVCDIRIDSSQLRDSTTYVCPFMGFIADSNPGCLVHPCTIGVDMRHHSIYGASICEEYLCPAHTLLDERLKTILVLYTDSWYTYSIGIMDPESFRWLIAYIENVIQKPIDLECAVDKTISRIINDSLNLLAEFFNDIKAPLFHYSVSEYYLNMRTISLSLSTKSNERLRTIITNMIDEYITTFFL